ncbi:hypothetical protein [Curtobacterium flaccumfaciens]|uniref:hypothetical protein n=1 Tax=Curtobacterium flaccumfaciens TaxID=2035 RepID=UPI001BDEE39A|nr:hypothetical protein [Curtobacterium flaccumfaciens]MBT1671828.1 hypothetical protein [Curtobacterium flaccumfaciens pv. flaccumfaciens]
MRTLLHAPRPRRRSIAAATLGALALAGSLLVAMPAQAINDTGTGGVFVPASGRALDTLKGTGGYSTPMPANTWRTVKIAGLPGIPDDGSVGAVSLNVTASGTTAYGTVFGRPDADTSRTMMMIYNGAQGEYVSNSAVVAVSAAGTIQVQTETAARLILDVQGYYTANADGTAAGGFVPVAGKRIVDTRSGLGARKALLAPGKSVDIQITGANGVPAGASAAVVNLLPINTASSDGYLTPYATGTTRPANALHYAPSVNTSIQAQVPLSPDGEMTIYNSSSTANLVIDLQGYFTAAGAAGATFTPGVGRVFNSRAADSSILAKNETRAIPVAGTAGLPVMGSGISAVVLTLTALHGGSAGRASVWANGTAQPDTTSINFQADEIRTNTVTVALGANGKINLSNVADPTNYVIDVQGWYSNVTAPTITCERPFQAGAWSDAAEGPDGEALTATCTIVAPPAHATGDQVEIDNNGGEEAILDLSNTTATTKSVSVQVQPGRNVLETYVVSADGAEGPRTLMAFGTGNWNSAELVPLVGDGSTTYRNVVLGSNPATGDGYPEDASFNFQLRDDTTGEVVIDKDSGSGLIAVDEATLLPAHNYSWNQTIHGTLRWDDSMSRTSPTWRFTTASDEDVAEHDPSVENSEGSTNSKPSPESVVDEANQQAAVPYDEESSEPNGEFSTFGIKFGPCMFYPSGTWLRASSGYNDLGSKPMAKCSKTMAKLSFTSHPVRKNYVWVIETGSTEFWPAQTHTAYNTSKYTDNNLRYKCLNQHGGKHFWYFKTTGSALSKGGTWYYAQGNSRIEYKNCAAV